MEKINELQQLLVSHIEEEKAKIEAERQALLKEKEEWEASKKKLDAVQTGNRIKLDIGGQIFATSEATLINKKSKFFSAMFSGRWNVKKEEDGCCFIDRDPSVFQRKIWKKITHFRCS